MVVTAAVLNTPKDHTLYYHDMGFSVFVLRNPETGTDLQLEARKKPAVKWELYQIMRPSKIQFDRWFSKNPKYNLALVMGRISGNAVSFDVDGPTASKRVEVKRMEMSSTLRDALDNTMMIKTGGGGMQIIFRVEGEGSIDDISQERLWSDGKPHSEILMQGNEHYIIPEPSIHPNNNRYQWNGKESQTITRQQLDEFIRLVGSNESKNNKQSRSQQQQKQQQPDWAPAAPSSSSSIMILRRPSLSAEETERLLTTLKPRYVRGRRHRITLGYSGFLRKRGYSLQAVEEFCVIVCQTFNDEEFDSRLHDVRDTFNKPLDRIAGWSLLNDIS